MNERKSFRAAVAGAIATTVVLAAGVAIALSAPDKGYAVIAAINPTAGTVTLLGEVFAVTANTEIVDERGTPLLLAELDAIDPVVAGRIPNPDTGDSVYYEATSSGSPRALIKLRRMETPR